MNHQLEPGSPWVSATLEHAVLRVQIKRPERRNAMTQDMYRAEKRDTAWRG